MKRKNICFLLGSFQTGGAENNVLQILKNLDNTKYNPHIAVFNNSGSLKKDFYDLNIPIYYSNNFKYKLCKKLFHRFKVFSFSQFLNKNNIDILHIHLTGCFIFGIISAYLANIPSKIITWHNIYDNSQRKWRSLNDLLNHLKGFTQVKIASMLSKEIIAVSNKVKKRNCSFFNVPLNKVTVVHNGIDISRFNKKTYNENEKNIKNFEIVAVGALQRQKGYFIMLDAVKEIIKKYPFIILKILGRGPDEEKIKKYICNNKLSDNVLLLGNRNDVPSILFKSDLFLMTSLWEGFSIALLEAMAVGLPIIATDVGGNSEAINNNVNGIIVPIKKSQSVIDSIDFLISNKSIREKLGKQAYKDLNSKFTIDTMINNLCKVYNK